jgi:hypothetical protein
MKRLLACIVCLSLCSLLLCSCGSGSSSASVTSTVTQSETIPLGTASPEITGDGDAVSLAASSESGQFLCATRWYYESGDAIWVFSQDGSYEKQLVSETYSGTWTLSDNGDLIQLSMTDGQDGVTKTYQVTINDDNTMELLTSEGKQVRLTPFGA